MHLSGSPLYALTELGLGAPESLGMSASASISATVIFDNRVPIGDGSFGISSFNGEAPTMNSSGWLTDFDGNDTLTSDSFTVPLNTPFTLSFKLSATASNVFNGDDTGLAESSADFGNTFSFALDGQPVFDLPDGYTANSVSAGLIDNQYVELPEPGFAALFAAALVAVVRPRRFRKCPQV
jgi:hypothetical protein